MQITRRLGTVRVVSSDADLTGLPCISCDPAESLPKKLDRSGFRQFSFALLADFELSLASLLVGGCDHPVAIEHVDRLVPVMDMAVFCATPARIKPGTAQRRS